MIAQVAGVALVLLAVLAVNLRLPVRGWTWRLATAALAAGGGAAWVADRQVPAAVASFLLAVAAVIGPSLPAAGKWRRR